MKKIIVFIVTVLIMLTVFSGCEEKVIVSKEPIDTRFTSAHDEVVDNGYWIDDYYVCDHFTVYHADKYEVLYRITYEDESQRTIWLEVDKKEYDSARERLP